MKNETLFWAYFGILAKEHVLHCFIESYAYVSKTVIFTYHQCAKVYDFTILDDIIIVESWNTVDFDDPHATKMELIDKINFKEFLEKYPKDPDPNRARYVKYEITYTKILEKILEEHTNNGD